jgi:hypothetical protein
MITFEMHRPLEVLSDSGLELAVSELSTVAHLRDLRIASVLPIQNKVDVVGVVCDFEGCARIGRQHKQTPVGRIVNFIQFH